MPDQEPVVTFPTAINALVGLIIAFGARWEFHLTEAEVAAIMLASTVVGAVIARRFVWSQRSVEIVTGRPVEVAEAALERRQTIAELSPHAEAEARKKAAS